MTNKLFVYGSLMSGVSTPIATYLKDNSLFLGVAVLEGTLYDLGKYPGIIPQLGSGTWVQGHVFELSDPKRMLPILDRYEGCGEEFPNPTEYVRVLTTVKMEEDTLDCWVYQFNYSIEGLSVIKSGNYLAYLEKNAAFQGFIEGLEGFTRH